MAAWKLGAFGGQSVKRAHTYGYRKVIVRQRDRIGHWVWVGLSDGRIYVYTY